MGPRGGTLVARLGLQLGCFVAARWVAAIPWCREERREHFLQARNEHVGFAGAFGQFFYLAVLDLDLAAQKFVLAFEQARVAVVGGANGRVRSRLFGVVRCCSLLFVARNVVVFQSANGGVRSRLVATSRDRSHLIDVRDVALHGVGRHEVFFAGLGLDLVAIEL